MCAFLVSLIIGKSPRSGTPTLLGNPQILIILILNTARSQRFVIQQPSHNAATLSIGARVLQREGDCENIGQTSTGRKFV